MAIVKFLNPDTSKCKHGNAPVLNLLGADDLSLLGIIRVKVEGVEALVTRVGVGAEDGGAAHGCGLLTCLPELQNITSLDKCADEDKKCSEARGGGQRLVPVGK